MLRLSVKIFGWAVPSAGRWRWVGVSIGLSIGLLIVLGFAVGSEAAEPPRIDRIEYFLTDQVTVHFDTDANRTYELQFSRTSAAGASWSNLFVAPRLPFPNHYIVVDTRTNQVRIYRLRVTP